MAWGIPDGVRSIPDESRRSPCGRPARCALVTGLAAAAGSWP